MAPAPARYGPRVASGRESPASAMATNGFRDPANGMTTSSSFPSRNVSMGHIGQQVKPPMGSQDEVFQSRETARSHYLELWEFLTENGQQPPPSRNSAREKLTRLTRQQFQELSTDVYDELLRRKSAHSPDSEGCLPVQDSYHPKRNQARQKLATLPDSRYRDLASDVFFELERRYPEFREDLVSPPSSRPFASSAANEVLIPNKSTLVEEDVRLPPPPKSATPPSDNGRYLDNADKKSMGRNSEVSSVGGKVIGGYGHGSDRTSWDQAEQEKMRSDYEYKIATMQQRMTSLEADLQDAQARAQNSVRETNRLRELEDDLRLHKQRYDDQNGTIRSLQREVEEHKAASTRDRDVREDSTRLRRDLEDVRLLLRERDNIIVDLRQEVKGLLDQLRTTNMRQDDILAQRDRDLDIIKELEGQTNSFKQRYETAKTELRTMKATSGLFVQPPEQNDFLPASEDGGIADLHITAFQSSIDSLLVAGRSDQPSSVLSMTKAVVFAVTRLDEDITDYEARQPHAINEEDRERLQALKAKCNATLSNLVTAAKNHAAGFGMSPVSLLDAAASHLSVTVIDLARLVRIRKASKTDFSESGRPLPSPLPHISPPPLTVNTSPLKTNNSNAAVSRLGALKRGNTSPTSSRGSPISPAPSQAAGSYTTNGNSFPSRKDTADSPVAYQDARYPTNHRSPQSASPHNGMTPSSAAYAQPQRTGEDARGRAGGFSPEVQQRTPHSIALESPMDDGHSYDDAHDQSFFTAENYEELRDYCEQQTEAIVHSIQSLLAAVRSGASGEEIHENLTQIITVVSSIVGVTKDNMPPHARREGDDILRDLAESCDKLSAMQAASHESFSKETKQKLASVSFGAAKALKALNSFLARETVETT